MIDDDEVDRCAALIDRSGAAQWLEQELVARHRRRGRPRQLSVRALLVALLLLASDDRALHLTGATEVLFRRLSERARTTLGVHGVVVDRHSFLARYRQVRYLFASIASVLDPSRLAKNRRCHPDEFAGRCRSLGHEEEQLARERLESFMGRLLSASVEEFSADWTRRDLAYGLDATPVPLFSRGPSRRQSLRQ